MKTLLQSVIVSIFVLTVAASTAVSVPVVLVEDHFDAPQIDLNKWAFQTTGSGYYGIGGPTGLLNICSGYSGSGSALVRSYTSASLEDYSEIIFRGRLLAYEDSHTIYDPFKMPRGLRDGISSSNAIEFFSEAWNVIGTRTTANGSSTTSYYTIPASVCNFYTYEIVATPTSVTFSLDGSVIATHTTNIPTNSLNIYMSTSDINVGNVPINADNLYLAVTPEPASLGLLAIGGLAILRRRK